MKARATDRNRRYSTAGEMLADLEAFRKDPSVSFDYSAEDLRPERCGEDEPTQNIPNVGAARPRQVRYALHCGARLLIADDPRCAVAAANILNGENKSAV